MSETIVTSTGEVAVTSQPSSLPHARYSTEPYMKIVGAWTKAGISSCVQVKVPSSNLDLLLDCGVAEIQTLHAQLVFITHGHMDHAGACISHARAKALNSSPSTYYIPSAIKEAFMMAKQGFELMDGREIPMNIVEVNPNDEIVISSELKVKVFATEHRVPSQGYIFYHVKRGTILPEYQHLSGHEKGQLKKQGINILSPSEEHAELVYTGDTTFEGLLASTYREVIFQARTLITELTYLNGLRTNAAKYKHIHIEDIREYEEVFQNDEVVFVHLSQKYALSQAVELIRTQLSGELLKKVKVSLHSFGAREVLTSVVTQAWTAPRQQSPGWGWSNSGYQQVSYRNEHARSNLGGRGTQRGYDERSSGRGRGRPFAGGDGRGSKKFKKQG